MINRLILTAWDMWQYRNNRLHGKAGPLAFARHSVLDNRTEEEMIAGYAGMTQHTQHFFRSETLLDLKRFISEGRNMLPPRSLLLHLNKKATPCVLGIKCFYLLRSFILSFSEFFPPPSRVSYLQPISLCIMLIFWISLIRFLRRLGSFYG